jgi:Flp pilus assembly protein TadG
MMVLGIIEFGRGFMVQHVLTAAARQGCRTAILPGKSTAAVQAVISNALTGAGVKGATASVLVNGAPVNASSAQSNDQITVSISVPVSSVTWVPVGRYLTGTLNGQASLRRE